MSDTGTHLDFMCISTATAILQGSSVPTACWTLKGQMGFASCSLPYSSLLLRTQQGVASLVLGCTSRSVSHGSVYVE